MTSTGGGPPIAVGVMDHQRGALAWAAEEAGRQDCGLCLVHAYTVPPAPPDMMGAAYGLDVSGTFRESGREVIAVAMDFLAARHPDPDLQRVLRQGAAPRVLRTVAETSRLLVIGPDDGTPWYGRLLRGRVARALVEDAPCPVVVVPDAWDGEGPGGVTLLVDCRTVAHGPLRFAFDQASQRGATLRIVHLQAPDDAREPTVSWHDMGRLVESWSARYPHVRVETTVVAVAPDRGTIESYERTGLLVLGRRHEQGVLAWLRTSTAQSIVERAVCPVAVVPADHDG